MRGLVSHTRGLENRALTSLLATALATALPPARDLGQGLAPAESQSLHLHKGYGRVGREVTSASLGFLRS